MIETYKTGKKKLFFIITVLTLMVVATVAFLCYAYVYNKKISTFVPPALEKSAKDGVPENVPEELSYSPLTTMDGKMIAACAQPELEDEEMLIYFTNCESNTAWMQCKVFDDEDNFLGQCNLIKPGQYVRGISLNSIPKEDIKINIKVVSFTPDTYYSDGSFNLSTTMKVA